MRKVQRNTILFLSLIALGLPCFAQIPRRVKVIADYADIRSNPGLDAEVLNIASKGEIYAVADKSGPWYKIKLSVDQAGQVSYGYIHESMVTTLEISEGKKEVVGKPKEPEPPAKPREEKRPTKARPEAQVEQKTKLPQKVISGLFLNYGFGDHWLISLGYDFGIHRNFALGFELQPYYSKDSDLDLSVVETNVFINAKAGFRFSFISLYGGGGIGRYLSYVTTEIEGESLSQFESKLAYHVLAGTALNFGPIALFFEYQMIMVSDPAVDPDAWTHFFLIGVRF